VLRVNDCHLQLLDKNCFSNCNMSRANLSRKCSRTTALGKEDVAYYNRIEHMTK
jgi:hypothetical protein